MPSSFSDPEGTGRPCLQGSNLFGSFVLPLQGFVLLHMDFKWPGEKRMLNADLTSLTNATNDSNVLNEKQKEREGESESVGGAGRESLD